MLLTKLKNTEWGKVLKGAGIAAGGAALAYLYHWASGQDFGTATPIIMAGFSFALNAFNKFVQAESGE